MTLEQYYTQAQQAIAAAQTVATLEDVRHSIFGKKGWITEALKALSGMDPEQRRTQGALLNQFRDTLQQQIETRKQDLAHQELQQKLKAEAIDVTLPPRPETPGALHPVMATMEFMVRFFRTMGFELATGPDVEDDDHNFNALNIPPDHPARQNHDTFYLPPKADGQVRLLRTHTSPVQIRTMRQSQPPIRVIAPGRVYRCDDDATHTPMFHQIEGLWIDEAIHMGHLKGCLIEFCEAFFGVKDLPVRFRPGFFPFTEPSAEMDIGCRRHGGQIEIGAGLDWLEVLGCGMVHPNVLRNCGIDPDRYQGFAFGLGIDRFAMLKYGIADLRGCFGNDNRWLSRYGFTLLDQFRLQGGVA
jgi:phenylalanyl-tRNA synthetase alpha chain